MPAFFSYRDSSWTLSPPLPPLPQRRPMPPPTPWLNADPFTTGLVDGEGHIDLQEPCPSSCSLDYSIRGLTMEVRAGTGYTLAETLGFAPLCSTVAPQIASTLRTGAHVCHCEGNTEHCRDGYCSPDVVHVMYGTSLYRPCFTSTPVMGPCGVTPCPPPPPMPPPPPPSPPPPPELAKPVCTEWCLAFSNSFYCRPSDFSESGGLCSGCPSVNGCKHVAAPAMPTHQQSPPAPTSCMCVESCPYSSDGDCDDGGEGSEYTICNLGTDCHDCGPRCDGASTPPATTPSPPLSASQAFAGSVDPSAGITDLATGFAAVLVFFALVLLVRLRCAGYRQPACLRPACLRPSTRPIDPMATAAQPLSKALTRQEEADVADSSVELNEAALEAEEEPPPYVATMSLE